MDDESHHALHDRRAGLDAGGEEPDSDVDRWSLTETETGTLAPQKLAKSAGGKLTLKDLTAELARLPERYKSKVARGLSRSASTPPAAMANALRSAIARSNDELTREVLHDCLHVAVKAADMTSFLEEHELAALLSAAPAGLGFLADSPLRQRLVEGPAAFGVSASVRTAAWSSMGSTGHSGSVAAVAWLPAAPPEFWTAEQREAAEQVWAEVCVRFPALPQHPAPLGQLCDTVADLELRGEIDAADAPAPVDEDGEQQLTDLAQWADIVRYDYEAARDSALPALVADLTAGRVPSAQALSQINDAADALERLLRHVSAAVPEAEVDTIDAASTALAEALASIAADDLAARVRVLKSLTGPEYAAADVRLVSELAATAGEDSDPGQLEALDALLSLIELGPGNPERSAELMRVATAGLPTLSVLAMLATSGALAVAEASDDRTAPASPAPSPSLEPVREAETEGDEAPLDEDEAAPTTGVSDEALLADSEPEPGGNSDVSATGADEKTPTQDHGTAPNSPSSPASLSADLVDTTDSSATPPDAGAGLSQDTQSAVQAPTQAAAAQLAAPSPATVAADDPAAELSMDEALAKLGLTAANVAARSLARQPATAAAPADTDGASKGETGDLDGAGDGHVRSGDGSAADIVLLRQRLLDEQQYALAGWLAQTCDGNSSETLAYRLAAHAAALRTAAGTNAAAFKDIVAELATSGADALREAPASQMLVYASAARAGLLSPTAGAADPLRDLCPRVVKSGPGIETLTEALLEYVYTGAYLTAHGSNVAAEAASSEAEFSALVAQARTLLDTASSRTIRYAAATDLYKAWMAPDGYLGAPLSAVASGERRPDAVKFVRERVTELRSKTGLANALDRDARAIHGKRARRIEARARDNIMERAGDVAAVLERWVETAEAMTQAGTSGWMADQFTQLRSRVNEIRDQAVNELSAMFDTLDDNDRPTANAGLDMLFEVLAMVVDGVMFDDPNEMPADRVENGLLCLADELPLTASPAVAPARDVTVDDIADAAGALSGDNGGWTGAFSRRSERGDHVGTGVLVEMIRARDPQAGRRLSALREREIDAATARLDTDVADVAARLDSDRRFGRLDSDAWAALSISARALEPAARGQRYDFDAMAAALEQISADRDTAVAAAVEAKWAQLSSWQEQSLLDETQAGRIADCLAVEDVTTADEYFETVRTRGTLPAPKARIDDLSRFFPAFPLLFSGRNSDSQLPYLRTALEKGANPSTGPLADALAGAGIDLSAVLRQPAAASRVEQWMTLASAKTLDGKLSQVKPVLEQIGFSVEKASTPERRRTRSTASGSTSWMHLSGVRAVEGKALIPAFGSKISPTGNTLRVLGAWGSPTPGRLVELLREEQQADHAVLVLYFGALTPDQRLELGALMRSGPRMPAAVVVDDAVFAYLCAQPTPRRDTTMAICLPFARSAPFTPDVAGLVPVEMFYGRTGELDQVLDPMGSCFVYGGRQLGKSALLRAAARRFGIGEQRAAIYHSIYQVGQGTIPADKVWPTIWPRLADKGIVPADIPAEDVAGAACRHILGWIAASPGRQLLLLLDESDFFLDDDAKEGKFSNVDRFRYLMEQTARAVKVVFAGLHQTARFERLPNHPLAHFGKPVCVGPLAPQFAYDLLVEPLRALGYRFDDDNVASRVLALANNQPSLVQLFGARLLTHLDAKPKRTLPATVTADDIEAVWADDELRVEFRRRFDWTLGLDPRYKVIAYSVAYNAYSTSVGAGLTATELRSQCEQWWPRGFAPEDVRTGEFRALLDECVALGVLSYAPAESAYRLRTPNVLTLLGSRDEVLGVLDAAESAELPDGFDGALLRPRFAGGNTTSPLTSGQIADLLEPRNQVRLIAGSDALTLNRCTRVLEDENSRAVHADRSIPIRKATAATLEQTCQTAAGSAAGHAVVIADLRTASAQAARDAWDTAREAIAARARGTLGVVLITGPEQAPVWRLALAQADASSSLMSLYRFDDTGLRLWLNDTELPFQDAATRDDLLRVSGGWPVVLNTIVDAASEHGARPDIAAVADRHLGTPAAAAAFLAEAGLAVDDTLAQAWEFLVANLGDESGDEQTLADLLELAGGEDDHPALAPAARAASGHGMPADVLTALRVLGLLPVTDAGDLALEPIAVAATRMAAMRTAATSPAPA